MMANDVPCARCCDIPSRPTMSGIRMIPPPTPRSPLTTPPASPIPISTGTGACRSALVAGAFSIGGVYGAHRARRPQPLAGCQPASRLPFVYYQCTLDLMSPQPGSRMPPFHPPLPLAAPSPGDVPWRLQLPPLAAGSCRLRGQVICGRAVLSPAPVTKTPNSRTPPDRQSPPKCTPRRLKSFLEKTLTRATPPHFALQPPPTSSVA